MTKRLQVLLDDDELREYQQVAKRHRMTLAQWVREALRAAGRAEPRHDTAVKLRTIREAARGSAPTADIEQMLSEIEQGYLGPEQP